MQKGILVLFTAFVLGCLIVVNVHAEDIKVDWSGFFDVQHVMNDDVTAVDGFTWGQFELDLAAELNEKISIEGAVCYDGTTGTFGLGAGLLNFAVSDKLSLSAGQFDVPVGIDLNYYPSPERALVSGPLLNEKMYYAWNDLGLKIDFEEKSFKGTVYSVNGMALAANKGNAQAYGTRLAYCLKDAEVGISYANDPTVLDVFTGIDVVYAINQLSTKAEYLMVANDTDNKATSYYLQLKYDIDKYFLVGRYGAYTEDSAYDRDWDGFSELSRISLGAGTRVYDKAEVRLEYQLNSEDNDASLVENNVLFLQTVIAF